MIDAVRDLFDRDDDAETPEQAAEGAREEVLTEVPRGLLRGVFEGGVERLLRADRDEGRRKLADALVAAIEAYHDPGRSPREEERIDAEERTLATLEDRIADRRDELDAEREARHAADRFDFCDAPPIDGHPDRDAINRALEACVDFLDAEGGATVDELYSVYDGHGLSPRERDRSWFVVRGLEALATHPAVEPERRGLWSLDPDAALDDAALEDALDGLSVSDEFAPSVARAYRQLREGPCAIGYAGGEWWMSEGIEYLADLPGVEPPETDAPAYRYVDPNGEGETDG